MEYDEGEGGSRRRGPCASAPLTGARVTIVGGGYSGATAAIQLIRRCPAKLSITIVEPRADVGRGVAYSTDDPDHRLNGTPATHVVEPSDPDQLGRWCAERGVLDRDPAAVAPDGTIFIRRGDFGRFVAETVRAHAKWRTGSTIDHVRDFAIDLRVGPSSLDVLTAKRRTLAADLLIVATGNAAPRLPATFPGEAAVHPGVVADPSDLRRVRAIARDARVLVVGSGLTALDVISTLVRAGHRQPITVVSRRGLRPRRQRPATAREAGIVLERIDGPVAPFIRAAGNPPTIRSLLRALREHIREVERGGGDWHDAFDDLRDVVWQVWPALATDEKRRFLRQLRAMYDVHRFRAPPQNEAIVREAEQRGLVVFRAARLQAVTMTGARGPLRIDLLARGAARVEVAHFDAVINCTGLDLAADRRDNPFLAALRRQGLLTVDPTGVGFAVDGHCRAIGANGARCDRIRVIGPPTAGALGDPLGVVFIAAQVRRAVPSMLAALEWETYPATRLRPE